MDDVRTFNKILFFCIFHAAMQRLRASSQVEEDMEEMRTEGKLDWNSFNLCPLFCVRFLYPFDPLGIIDSLDKKFIKAPLIDSFIYSTLTSILFWL